MGPIALCQDGIHYSETGEWNCEVWRPGQNHMRTAAQELAMASYRSGAYDHAIGLFEKALEEEENAECWNDLGCSQAACKLYGEAETSFRRALALDQCYRQARLNLGVLLASRGRSAEAIPILKRHSDEMDSQRCAELAPLLEHCLKEARRLTEAPFVPGTRRIRLLCLVTGFLQRGFSEANTREAWTLFKALGNPAGDLEPHFASIEPSASQPAHDAQRGIDSFPPTETARYLAENSFDLVHVYAPLIPFPVNYGAQRQPMVLTLTANDPVEDYPAEILDEIRHLIDFGRLALVCQSTGSLASLEREDLRVAAMIPPVMEPAPPRPEAPRRSTGFVVGFATAPLISEHWESRGVQMLLDLARLSPETQFLMAWRTSPQTINEAIASRALNNVTVLAGHLDMERFYERVDAMILPFGRPRANHGCPLSAVEGMLRGKPTLATEFAGIADWLQQEGAGVVVPPTAQHLREGLLRLQAEATEFSRQARWSARRHFDRDASVAAYRRLYSEMMEKPKGPTLREWELRVQSKGKELVRGRPALAEFYKQSEVATRYTADRFSAPPFQQMEEQGRAAIQRLIEMRFDRQTGLQLLDLATGPGRLLSCLLPFGATTALDGSEAMLEVARMRDLPNVSFLHGDIFDYPIGETFHVVTCGRLLRHLEYPDRRLLYRRFQELLREDGIAILEVPNRIAEYDFRDLAGWENFGVYDVFWTIPEFREELRQNGLQLFSFVSVGAGIALHPESRTTAEPLEYVVAFGKRRQVNDSRDPPAQGRHE